MIFSDSMEKNPVNENVSVYKHVSGSKSVLSAFYEIFKVRRLWVRVVIISEKLEYYNNKTRVCKGCCCC